MEGLPKAPAGARAGCRHILSRAGKRAMLLRRWSESVVLHEETVMLPLLRRRARLRCFALFLGLFCKRLLADVLVRRCCFRLTRRAGENAGEGAETGRKPLFSGRSQPRPSSTGDSEESSSSSDNMQVVELLLKLTLCFSVASSPVFLSSRRRKPDEYPPWSWVLCWDTGGGKQQSGVSGEKSRLNTVAQEGRAATKVGGA